MMDKVKKAKKKKEIPKTLKPSAKSQAMMDKVKKAKERNDRIKKEKEKKEEKKETELWDTIKDRKWNPNVLTKIKDVLTSANYKDRTYEIKGNKFIIKHKITEQWIEGMYGYNRENDDEDEKKQIEKDRKKIYTSRFTIPKEEPKKKEAPKKEAPKKKGKSKTIQTLKPIERNQLAGLLVKNFNVPLNRRFDRKDQYKVELEILYQKPNWWKDTPIIKLDNLSIQDIKENLINPTYGGRDPSFYKGLNWYHQLSDLPLPYSETNYFGGKFNKEYYEPNTIIRNWKDYLAFLHLKKDDFPRDDDKRRFLNIEAGYGNKLQFDSHFEEYGFVTSWKYKKDLTQPGDKAMKTFIDNYLANPPEINSNNLDMDTRYKLKKKFIMEEGTNKIDVIYKNQTLKMNAKEIITFVNNISGYKNLSKGQIEKLYKLFMYEPYIKGKIIDSHTDVKGKSTLLKKLNIQEGNKLVITPSFKFNENDEDAKAIASYQRNVAVLKIELKKE